MSSNAVKLAVAFAGALSLSLPTIGSRGAVNGRVTSVLGEPIGRAQVLFHFDPAGQEKPLSRPDLVVQSDAAGRFVVQLEPGFYDLCVFSPGVTAACQKLLVQDAGSIRQDIRLNADPLVIKHLGDVFIR
jgi:hypothetical protein